MTDIKLGFDSPDIEFRVSQEKRTISGLVVPWNQVATDASGMAKWRFREGSLHAAQVGRVKLNLFHDRTRPIGKALRLVSTRQGLDATFRIARGEEGDQILSLAEDGVLDGFSIEPHFGDEDGWEADESDRSVRNVKSARLSMVGLVPAPAFDDARATDVSLQLKEGIEMAENAIETVEETVEEKEEKSESAEFSLKDAADQLTEKHAELTVELGESIGKSVSAAFETMFDNLDQERGTVNASRLRVTREEPVYQFNGYGPSLVKDAWYAKTAKDDESIERLRKFRAQQLEVEKVATQRLSFANPQVTPKFTTVTTTSAADVIPPGYRPDLFVPQLQQSRPLVDLASRGSISNATPFVVPKFGDTNPDLVGDHTEGSPPTEGTLTLTQTTVNPVAVSGKLPLTREIVDSSNPGIDQIVLNALREDYAQQTEPKAFNELEANNTDSGVVFDPANPVVQIRSELASYSFTRFARPTGGALSPAATSGVADAQDSTGRPLIPAVGAQNAFGTADAVAGAWPIDGIGFVPAWALNPTGALSTAEIFIVNSADFFVWESPTLTFRFEEKQGPEIIEMALFGYFATAVLRPAGIVAIDHAAT